MTSDKKPAGSDWGFWALIGGAALILGGYAYFHRNDSRVPTSDAPVDRQVGGQPLVGRWQTKLASGEDEVLTFEPLAAFDEGVMRREVYVGGKLADSWSGKYKFHDNPLLGADDRRQLKMAHVHPALGKQEESVVLKSVSDTTLVIGSIYSKQVVRYQRLK